MTLAHNKKLTYNRVLTYKKVAATKAAATGGMSARNYFVVTLMLSRYHLFWLLAAF